MRCLPIEACEMTICEAPRKSTSFFVSAVNMEEENRANDILAHDQVLGKSFTRTECRHEMLSQFLCEENGANRRRHYVSYFAL